MVIPLIAIYLYTKFTLYANNNLNVLNLFAGQGTGRTNGRTKRRLYASPFGEHKNLLSS